VTNLVALNGQTHRNLRLATLAAMREYAAVNVVSVIPREFPRLLAQYPILFTKSTDSGQFEPAVLLGFERGENLFLNEGVWEGTYVPLQIQRQPFALIPRRDDTPGAQPSLDLALDLDNPHVQNNEGERLFQDDGKATGYLETMSAMLSALVNGAREAYAFTGRLAELNLLEPVRIDIEFVNSSETKLQGLYWVAANALKALTAEQLMKLRDEGYLEWMYFQMASLAHIAGLVARKNKKLAGVTPGQRRSG
jgi:SapC